MDNRRDFLKKAALLTGAAGMTNFLPEAIQKALAINAAPGSTYQDAEHVVILMQENRSFDHCYGALKGVRGFNDPRAIRLPNQNKVWLQSNAKGETYAPFRLDIKNTKATWMHSLPHSWKNQVEARNDGKYDQWLNVKRNGDPAYRDMPLTLGYHTREDLPFYYALADAFTVCDQNFCSSLTGTNPNRLYFWTGTIRAEQHENSKAHVWNEDMDYGTLNWATFPERLEDAGISWKCYQNEVAIDTGFEGEEDAWLSNFQDNPLEFFGQYHIHLYDAHVTALEKRWTDLSGQITELKTKISALPKDDKQIASLEGQLTHLQNHWDGINREHEKLKDKKFADLTGREKSLHLKAFDSNKNDPQHRRLTDLKYDDNGTERELKVPEGDILHQFREDVRTGKLPTVSWVTAPENYSDHPTAAWFGACYVSEVLDILTHNPDVWKKTIFILAYDENDGYFDHVPPFTAPHPHKTGTGKVSAGIDTSVEFVTHEQEKARDGFPMPYERESAIGLGYRVPLVIASPWSKGGWVNSEVFDHTSTLQFLEVFLSKKFNKTIKEPNIGNWRRTVCGDLTSVFRPYNGEEIAQPEFIPQKPFVESIHKAKFKKLPNNFKLLTAQEIEQINHNPLASPYMAKQEPGVKPSCALPYQLYADGKLSADRKSVEINFANRNDVFGAKTSGSPFNVYAPGKYLQTDANGKQQFQPVRTWAYALTPGDSLVDSWPLNEFENELYHLQVYGPNGFYRELKGNAADPNLAINVDYQRNTLNKNILTGNLIIELAALDNKDHVVYVTDNAYHQPVIKHTVNGRIPVTIDLQKSQGWYDLSITVRDHPTFSKRYAGRVETGRASISDPQMGGQI